MAFGLLLIYFKSRFELASRISWPAGLGVVVGKCAVLGDAKSKFIRSFKIPSLAFLQLPKLHDSTSEFEATKSKGT